MVKSQGRWAPRKDVPWTVEPQGDRACRVGIAVGAEDEKARRSVQ